MPLRVTVELIPGGDTRRTEKIGHLYITNLGSSEEGDLRVYEVVDCLTANGARWRVTHRRSEGWAALVSTALARRPVTTTPAPFGPDCPPVTP